MHLPAAGQWLTAGGSLLLSPSGVFKPTLAGLTPPAHL